MRALLITAMIMLTICTYYDEHEKYMLEQDVNRHDVTFIPAKENLKESSIE